MSGIDSYTKSCLHFQNRVWTFAGTAQIDTAQSKFGGASLLLDGDSDYITTPYSNDFSFGSGNFTIDCWIRINSESNCYICECGNSGSGCWNIQLYNNKVYFYIIYGTSNKECISTGTITADSTWHHVACVRDGNTNRIFIDGVQDGTVDVTGVTVNDSNGSVLAVGSNKSGSYLFNGWIDEFRVTKGLARWTANFTPPSAAADDPSYDANCPYVKSLLHFDGADAGTTFSDSLGRSWTASGDAQLDTAQKKFGSASLLLDGTGDYIYTSSSGDFNLTSSDFTLDCWVYIPTGSSGGAVASRRTNGENGWALNIWSDRTISLRAKLNDVWSDSWITTSSGFSLDTWHHIALVRYGNEWDIYVDGTSCASLTQSGSISDTDTYLCVGVATSNTTETPLNGWIDEFRFIVGKAAWTTNFTPATAAYDIETKSLLHFNEADGSTYTKDAAANWTMDGQAQFYDEVGKVWTAAGNAQLDTAQYKWTASGLFDGNGDKISTPDSADFAMGSGDWTVDCWIRAASTSVDNHMVMVQGIDGNYSWLNLRRTGSTLNFCSSSTGSSWNVADNVSIGTIAQDTWYHVAIVRDGNNLYYFLDGVKKGTIDVTGVTLMDSSDPLFIGGTDLSQWWDGWIEEFRISKGIARWTSDFTPPTEEYDAGAAYTIPALTDTDTALAPSINHVFPGYLTDTDSLLVPSINHVFPPALADTDTCVAPNYGIVVKLTSYLDDQDTVVSPAYGRREYLPTSLTDSDTMLRPMLDGPPAPRHRVKVNY